MKGNSINAPNSGHSARLLDLVRRAGLVRARDIAAIGVPRAYLQRLVDRGHLVQHARGIYGPSDAPITENHSLAQPQGTDTENAHSISESKRTPQGS